MRGYSLQLLDKIKAARPAKAAKLGLQAVKLNVPVMDIAEHMGVSRTAVYDWFTGRYAMNADALAKLEKFLDRAKAKKATKA